MNPHRTRTMKNTQLSMSQIRDYLFIECGGYCPECGKKMQNKDSKDMDTYMTVDHIIPKSCGGKRNLQNLRPLCKACNNKRGNKPMDVKAFKDFRGQWIVL